MSELIFPATLDGLGRIRWDEPELAAAELSKLAGKRVTVKVTRERLTRTIEQNRFLWATYGDAVAEAVDLVEVESGSPVFRTREDVHGFAKLLLLRRPVMTNMGEINLLGSTTTLSTAEFSTYVEMLIAKLAQYGVRIPGR